MFDSSIVSLRGKSSDESELGAELFQWQGIRDFIEDGPQRAEESNAEPEQAESEKQQEQNSVVQEEGVNHFNMIHITNAVENYHRILSIEKMVLCLK